MDYSLIILRFAQFASLLPVAAGIIKYRRLPPTARLFFYFMVFSACTEGIAYLLKQVYNNNMPFLYVFTFVEFTVFCYILLYRLKLFERYHRHLFIGLMILMLGLLSLDVWIHSIFRMNSISILAECTLIVFMGLAYLLQYIQSDSTTRITRDYIFWIASGATLFFASTFFFFSIYSISTNKQLTAFAGNFHSISSGLSYFFYMASFLVVTSGNRTEGST